MYIHLLGTYYLYFTSVHKCCYRMSTCLFMSENKPVISHLSSCQTDTPREDWKSNITCSIDVGVTLHWNICFLFFLLWFRSISRHDSAFKLLLVFHLCPGVVWYCMNVQGASHQPNQQTHAHSGARNNVLLTCREMSHHWQRLYSLIMASLENCLLEGL